MNEAIESISEELQQEVLSPLLDSATKDLLTSLWFNLDLNDLKILNLQYDNLINIDDLDSEIEDLSGQWQFSCDGIEYMINIQSLPVKLPSIPYIYSLIII